MIHETLCAISITATAKVPTIFVVSFFFQIIFISFSICTLVQKSHFHIVPYTQNERSDFLLLLLNENDRGRDRKIIYILFRSLAVDVDVVFTCRRYQCLCQLK